MSLAIVYMRHTFNHYQELYSISVAYGICEFVMCKDGHQVHWGESMSMLLIQRTEEYKAVKRWAEALGVQMAALREELKTWRANPRLTSTIGFPISTRTWKYVRSYKRTSSLPIEPGQHGLLWVFAFPICNTTRQIPGLVCHDKTLQQWQSEMRYLMFKMINFIFFLQTFTHLEFDTHLFPVQCSKQVFFEHSSTFPVSFCPCPSFFGTCCRHQTQNEWIFAKKNPKKFSSLNMKYLVFVVYSFGYRLKRISKSS